MLAWAGLELNFITAAEMGLLWICVGNSGVFSVHGLKASCAPHTTPQGGVWGAKESGGSLESGRGPGWWGCPSMSHTPQCHDLVAAAQGLAAHQLLGGERVFPFASFVFLELNSLGFVLYLCITIYYYYFISII